jgi:hypothetical protein
VSIEKPQYPDVPGDSYSWVIVDEVIYGNQMPWPVSANGAGASLQRLLMDGSGNNPANWTAAAPTPGQGTLTDRDGDGMPDFWETANHLNPDDPTDAAADSDQDGLSNLQEYLAGTNPRDAASALRFESVTVQSGGVALIFKAVAGKSYTVQYRDSFTGGAWATWRDVTPQPTNGPVEVVDAPVTNVTGRYYRLATPAFP